MVRASRHRRFMGTLYFPTLEKRESYCGTIHFPTDHTQRADPAHCINTDPIDQSFERSQGYIGGQGVD